MARECFCVRFAMRDALLDRKRGHLKHAYSHQPQHLKMFLCLPAKELAMYSCSVSIHGS